MTVRHYSLQEALSGFLSEMATGDTLKVNLRVSEKQARDIENYMNAYFEGRYEIVRPRGATTDGFPLEVRRYARKK